VAGPDYARLSLFNIALGRNRNTVTHTMYPVAARGRWRMECDFKREIVLCSHFFFLNPEMANRLVAIVRSSYYVVGNYAIQKSLELRLAKISFLYTTLIW